MAIILLNGHVLQIPLADESVHMVVSSPPYWGLRDYGLPPMVWGGESGCAHEWGVELVAGEGYSTGNQRKWQHGASRDEDPENWQAETSQGAFCRRCSAWRGHLGLEPTPDLYVEHMVLTFREVRRVLRADGTCWMNLGDCYTGNGDQYGDEKSTLQGRKQKGTQGAARFKKTGLKPKDLVGMPWRVALALQADGWWLRSDIIWHKPNPMPESVRDRPTKSHEYLFLLTKSQRYFYDAVAIKEPIAEATIGRVKRGNGDDHKNVNGAPGQTPHTMNQPRQYDADREAAKLRNKRSVWTIATKPYKGAHFATYPPDLVEPCIKAGTSERGVCPACGAPWVRVTEKEFAPQSDIKKPEGLVRSQNGLDASSNYAGSKRGTVHVETVDWKPSCKCPTAEPVPAVVFDPFIGSGTTLEVARQLGRNGVGLDLSFMYLRDQARKRLALDVLDRFVSGRGVCVNANGWSSLPLFQQIGDYDDSQ